MKKGLSGDEGIGFHGSLITNSSLDCRGNTLTATGGWPFAVELGGQFITVENCLINMGGFTAGIGIGVPYGYENMSNIIRNNTIFGFGETGKDGIQLRGTTGGVPDGGNNTVVDNTIYGDYLGQAGVCINSLSDNNTIENNIVYNCNWGFVSQASGKNNSFINNTVYNSTRGFFDSSDNNRFINGSTHDNTIDYWLFNQPKTTYFRNTNFTGERIIVITTGEWFNYINETTDGIWLNTSVSLSEYIARELTNLNNTLVQWNDTCTYFCSRTAYYNISGLLPSIYYNIFNNSILAYQLQTDASGTLPQFSIDLNGEHEIRVENQTIEYCQYYCRPLNKKPKRNPEVEFYVQVSEVDNIFMNNKNRLYYYNVDDDIIEKECYFYWYDKNIKNRNLCVNMVSKKTLLVGVMKK